MKLTLFADPIPDKKKKRRPVVRETEKPRRKKRKNGGSSDLDDFLASEDDEDDFRAADSDDDDSSSFRLDASSSRRSAFPFLTNLILLCGPTGSGKSSTVHAIANELGWSVFEVFPGIGKRGAKDIERYVGDVGKNHMVRAGTERVSTAEGLQSSSETKDPFANFRKPAATKPASTTTVSQEQPSAESKHATQSVILFDEVDVLYREEKDFWAGTSLFLRPSRSARSFTFSGRTSAVRQDLAAPSDHDLHRCVQPSQRCCKLTSACRPLSHPVRRTRTSENRPRPRSFDPLPRVRITSEGARR